MFECNIDFIAEFLQKELDGGDGEAEFFRNIHCPDPFDKKKEFIFPVVAVHPTGVYLVYLSNGSGKKQAGISSEILEYACRVFKSYFFTMVPIRSVFAFDTLGRSKICAKPLVYDFISKKIISDGFESVNDLTDYIKKYVQNSSVYPSNHEREDLAQRLVKEESEALVSDSEGKSCFVKKADKWFPLFDVDSDKVFNLSLFGGLIGIHRFYLGLYGSGLLYMFTLGLFGAGWLIDCIEMLLGCWKHNNKYLMPLKNKRRHTMKFVLVVCSIAALIYFSIIK